MNPPEPPASRSVDRLYDLIPSIYRQRDADQGYPLQALLQVIAEQVNIVESDLDQLYDNWFIETCQPWVIPYIGNLVGFQPISEGVDADPNSAESQLRQKYVFARALVANLVAMRRRKGTMAVLEALPMETAGWSARIVPFYRRLRTTQHVNHLRLDRGRSLDLRKPLTLHRLDGPFDRAARLLDVRRIDAPDTRGKYNIPGVGVFIWRVNAYSLTQTSAMCIDEAGPNCYTFNPLGHDQQLFTRPRRERDPRRIASELDVPMPIPPYAFADRSNPAEPVASSRHYGPQKSLAIWAPGWGKKLADANPIPRQNVIPRDLANWEFEPPQDHVAVDVARGRMVFPPRQLPDSDKGVQVTYQYGFPADMAGGEYQRVLSEPPDAVTYHVGHQRPTDKQTYFNRLGAAIEYWQKLATRSDHTIIEIGDSRIYTGSIEITLSAGETLQIRAANGCRPIIRPRQHRAGTPHLAHVTSAPGSCFVMDGLLLTGGALRLEPSQDASSPDCTAIRRVTLRHCTLVPGWGVHCNCEPRSPAAASIEILGARLRLAVQHSIVGKIQVLEDEARTAPIQIDFSDSILDATAVDREALGTPGSGFADAILCMKRCTAIGRVEVHAIQLIEDSIIVGHLQVARRQEGCVRFCWIEPHSRTPRRFHCQPDLALQALKNSAEWRQADEPTREHLLRARVIRVRPQFNSLRYGSAAYCQLSRTCAQEIARGASDESEMGAFHDLFQPQRLASLLAQMQQFTPAGDEVAIIPVT